MGFRVAIVGATGVVGKELISVLEDRSFPVSALTCIASEYSRNKRITFRGEESEVKTLTRFSFRKSDFVFFCAGSDVSRRFAPIARDAGALAIDLSSAFRMDPRVPLVIPEINAGAARKHEGIIANPNCTTTILLMALYPLRSYGIKRVVVASYQAVSGAGGKGIIQLEDEILRWALDETRSRVLEEFSNTPKDIVKSPFPREIAFNLFPHIGEFLENGYSEEEMKCHNETRKIFEDPRIRVSATCVRVPVIRAHSVAASIEFRTTVSRKEIISRLKQAQGVEVCENPNDYPTPKEVSGKDLCIVGRIRKDYTVRNSLSFWVVGDQLRKGAALNAVQIAELFIS